MFCEKTTKTQNRPLVLPEYADIEDEEKPNYTTSLVSSYSITTGLYVEDQSWDGSVIEF